MGALEVKLAEEEIGGLRDAAEKVELSAGRHGKEDLYADTPESSS